MSQRLRVIGGWGVVILELGFKGGRPEARLRLLIIVGFEMGAGGGVVGRKIGSELSIEGLEE